MTVEINRKDDLSSAYSTLLKVMRTVGMQESDAIVYRGGIEAAAPVAQLASEIEAMCRRTLPEPEVLRKQTERLIDACDAYRERWMKPVG